MGGRNLVVALPKTTVGPVPTRELPPRMPHLQREEEGEVE